jgi:serine/threonine protein kinase
VFSSHNIALKQTKPERILGSPYSVKSDVWSFGMTLLELAIGRFPLVSEDGRSLAVFELLQRIVNEPVPTLPSGNSYSSELKDFINIWLERERERVKCRVRELSLNYLFL